MPPVPPTRAAEDALHQQGFEVIAGCDEVGRGAWAGPLLVVAAIAGPGEPPAGLTDSKALTAARRTTLAPGVGAWVRAWAPGWATPGEIDTVGMSGALHLAARRALDALPVTPDAVILDGPHDYIGAPWHVVPIIKADLSSTVVSAASVLAKVLRDAHMGELGQDWPAYGFDRNAGYPAPAHRAAIAAHGPTAVHRMSWKYWLDYPAWAHLHAPITAPGRPRQTRTASGPARADEPLPGL